MTTTTPSASASESPRDAETVASYTPRTAVVLAVAAFFVVFFMPIALFAHTTIRPIAYAVQDRLGMTKTNSWQYRQQASATPERTSHDEGGLSQQADLPTAENALESTAEESPGEDTVQDTEWDTTATTATTKSTTAAATTTKALAPTATLRETLDAHAAPDAEIVVTWVNAAYLDFAENFVKLLAASGHAAVFVASMDDEASAALVRLGIPTFKMPLADRIQQSGSDLGWGSPRFHLMGRAKAALLREILSAGRTVWFCDVDVAFLRSPDDWLKEQTDEVKNADVLASSDHLRSSTEEGDEGLEWNFEAAAPMNIGMMRFRPTDGATKFVDAWISAIEGDANYWDQNAFNDLVRVGVDMKYRPKVPSQPRVFRGHGGQIGVGILPVSVFANGHTFFVSRLHEMHKVKPVAAHATFQYCGTEGKRHRFREAKLWRVDPQEYYDRPGGFLSLNLNVDKAAAEAAATTYNGKLATVKPHFDVVHAQLRQIRDAMTIAVALGRSLVVPQLLCPLDRVWFAHTGVFPGSALKLPFACPLDHVLEVDVLQRESLPMDHFGPPISIRESSFLESARMKPHWVTRTEVTICDESDSDCVGDDNTKASVRVPANLTDEGWRRVQRESFQDVRVVHLRDVPPLTSFAGFEDSVASNRFRERLKMSGGPWGQIVRNQGAGHIWYDLYHDTAPFTDRFGRAREGPWEPRPGDA